MSVTKVSVVSLAIMSFRTASGLTQLVCCVQTSGVTSALQEFLTALLSSLNSAQTYQNFDNLTGPVVKVCTLR